MARPHIERVFRVYIKASRPPRCQRTSISGLKITAASSRDGNNRYSQTKISLSVLHNLTGAGTERFD